MTIRSQRNHGAVLKAKEQALVGLSERFSGTPQPGRLIEEGQCQVFVLNNIDLNINCDNL